MLTDQWTPLTLSDRVQITHNTVLVTFDLPDKDKALNLPTCACVLCKYNDPKSNQEVIRPYTPVSTNALKGKVRIIVKVYELGNMSQHLNNIPVGSKVDFKHIAKNVKMQYPFKKQHVTMICGGTGIAPMIQALHAILGTPGDTTEVTMICGNRTSDDILCKELLDSWVGEFESRLKVVHVLSAADDDLEWKGEKGFITREIITKHSAPPYMDTMVFVVGPPPMYTALCGPREDPELTGTLKGMGFKAEQVYKF